MLKMHLKMVVTQCKDNAPLVTQVPELSGAGLLSTNSGRKSSYSVTPLRARAVLDGYCGGKTLAKSYAEIRGGIEWLQLITNT